MLPHAERLLSTYLGLQFELVSLESLRAGKGGGSSTDDSDCAAMLVRFIARVAARPPWTILLVRRTAVTELHRCAATTGTLLGAVDRIMDAGEFIYIFLINTPVTLLYFITE